MTPVWFVSLLRLAWQLHSQKGCIPPTLLYRCNDIPSTHNMGQVIGRIETKATATYLSVLVGETMAHIAPAPRFSPLPLFSSLFLPFVYRTDHNFLAQFATPPSSLEHQSNRAGLRTQQTVQNSTHTHTHTRTHTRTRNYGSRKGRRPEEWYTFYARPACYLAAKKWNCSPRYNRVPHGYIKSEEKEDREKAGPSTGITHMEEAPGHISRCAKQKSHHHKLQP